MNKITVEINGETFRLVKGDPNELTCPKCALYKLCNGSGSCFLANAIDTEHPYDYYFVCDTPPQDPYPDTIDILRFREAVKAASNFANYRKYHGCTQTRDDFFVDGVIWADNNPKCQQDDGGVEQKSVVPRFKVGDKVRLKGCHGWYNVTKIEGSVYHLTAHDALPFLLPFSQQEDWEVEQEPANA